MYVSRYTLFFPIENTEDIILLNPLSGAVDIIDSEVVDIINKIKDGKPENPKIVELLYRRRYIFDKIETEERLIEEAFKQWKQNIASEPESYFIYPTYACNLRCTYCFQTDEMKSGEIIKSQVIDKAFEVMKQVHEKGESQEPPLVTLFGGEPLLYRKSQKAIVEYILTKCRDFKFNSKLITNGVDLIHYIDLIKEYITKHIQVTLDGPKDVHDKRRVFADGKGSFDRIVQGMDSVIKEIGMHIALRINVDKENIHSLPEMARFIIEKGWDETGLVTPYIAAVRDSGCVADKNNIPLPKLLKTIFTMYREYPETKVITLMGWKWIESIENVIRKGWLYSPFFNLCGAGIKRLCFDPFGDLYACAGFAGMKNFAVGKFYPELKYYSDVLEAWEKRTILTLPKCKKCPYNLLCGGGCTYNAVIMNNSIHSSPCFGIRELLNLGLHYYYPYLKEKTKGAKNASESS